MPKPTFTISRASIHDVPRIGEISTRAFDRDSHSQMKIMGQRPGAFAKGMAMGASPWIETQRGVLLKATDDRDGTTVGSIAWGFRGIELDASQSDDGGDTKGEEENREEDVGDGEEAGPIPGEERIKELEAMTSKHLSDFSDRIMPEGTKCMFIGGVSVDAKYEGQGIGSQLIRWGTEHADRHGVFCWVHSSEAGRHLFEKNGFKEVERLTIDMDQWAVGPPPKNGVFGDREKWGEYTFRYMVRQPM
ncbi:putative GNAT family acetyltransferase [Dactylonectria estremocensis]|uniref:GNAT family acetyltransferase n=1 Tax=Dactylonectria estremocensis TaxID=1079267 RepID=A0A9P9JF43_9HYPO|nr:putative GNAT family acetyltransferase [Dactylonectria estremocensis]